MPLSGRGLSTSKMLRGPVIRARKWDDPMIKLPKHVAADFRTLELQSAIGKTRSNTDAVAELLKGPNAGCVYSFTHPVGNKSLGGGEVVAKTRDPSSRHGTLLNARTQQRTFGWTPVEVLQDMHLSSAK